MVHWKEAAVTNDGAEMLNEWMAGRKITITSAYGGTGTVDPELLTEQTGLVDMRQKLHLLGEENGADGKTVQVQVQNAEVMTEYELNQVGVYAALDVDRDPDAEERLLFIMQDEKGVTIPAAMDASFLLELYCMIGITNNGRFEVSVSAAGIVTAAYLWEVLERTIAAHNADPGAHNSLAARMLAIETALNGSGTIIQAGDPTIETAGQEGQHYINSKTGAEFECVEVNEDGYIWNPAESGKSIRDLLGATGSMENSLAVEEHNEDPEAHPSLAARVRGIEVALNGSETITGGGAPTAETEGIKGQRYINSVTGEEFVCIDVTEDGCVWELQEAAGAAVQSLAAHEKDPEAHGDIRDILTDKQDALTGQPGQVVGFDGSGAAVAVRGWSGQNLVDNGGFDIWQKGTSIDVSGGIVYTADRWANGYQLCTHERVDNPIAECDTPYAMKVTCAKDGQYAGVKQFIEPELAALLEGKTVTISAWVVGQSEARFSVALSGFFQTEWTALSGQPQRVSATGVFSTSTNTTLLLSYACYESFFLLLITVKTFILPNSRKKFSANLDKGTFIVDNEFTHSQQNGRS